MYINVDVSLGIKTIYFMKKDIFFRLYTKRRYNEFSG